MGSAIGKARAEWTIATVEEALVECHELWRRSPGQGKWPFAGDGPWHLAQGEVGDIAGDYSETLIHTDAGKELRVRKVDARAPRAPLDAAEVSERDRVTAWLELLPEAMDRAIVHHATVAIWRGEKRPPWARIKRMIGWDRTGSALSMRYVKALALIVCRLNGWGSHRVPALAEAGRRYEPWQGEPVPERKPMIVKSLDPDAKP